MTICKVQPNASCWMMKRSSPDLDARSRPWSRTCRRSSHLAFAGRAGWRKAVAIEGRRSRRRARRQFLRALVGQVRLLWPILSGLALLMAAVGTVIGRIEGWGLGESLYFTFVTGLTIGYGD